MIVVYEPSLKETIQNFDSIINMCRHKLQFEYFINDDLLFNLNITNICKEKTQKSKKILLKFSNKFNPPLLMKVGGLIEKFYKFRVQEYEKSQS